MEEEEKTQNKNPKQMERQETLVRIMQTDIKGRTNVYAGLTRIKGISFSLSNAICKTLELDKRKKVEDLSPEEIEAINKTVKNLEIPDFLKNRRKDFNSGESEHLTTTDLDLRKDFDIKRLIKIRAYRGVRHSRGLPVRGQRTRSNFRKKNKNKAMGVKKK